MDLSLDGKRMLITASTDGIGYEIAKQFLKEGAMVLINGRDVCKAKEKKKKLQEEYGRDKVFLYIGDATKEDELLRMREYIAELWGTVNGIVANVGSGKPVGTRRLDLLEWENSYSINLFSAVKLIDIFDGLWEEEKSGNIILMSSIAAYDVISAPYAYAAAKNGIRTLVKYLADDYAKRGIRVNCVVPGNVFYPGGRWEELLSQDYEGVHQYIDKNVPLKRFARPEEIASAVVFLASERASFITGTALIVDGGQCRGIF